MEILFWTLLITNLYLVGLIWSVQIVHYPSFHFVDKTRFPEFSQFHQKAITKIVAFPMLLELGLAILLPILYSVDWRSLTILGLTLFIWGCTFFISVPLHSKLLLAYGKNWVDQLILTNWLRTAGWSLKALLLVVWLDHYV